MKRAISTLAIVLGVTILLGVALVAAVPARADNVTFDYEPLWATYGLPTAMAPGDFMFSEGGADLYLANFLSGGIPYFNFARIDPPFTGPTIFFGNVQILNTNNVDVVFDFSIPGNVTFDYLNLGGSVNLQVNGFAAVLEGPSLASLAGVVAPGVTMTVTAVPMGGAVTGVVTLNGPVATLRVGGQEFYLDRVQNDNSFPVVAGCDYEVTHQALSLGTTWGLGTELPGEVIFIEDNIPVQIGEIDWGAATGYDQCQVVAPGIPGFGFDRVMWLGNVSNTYDIAALGIQTAMVTFEYADLGGVENLQVNGAALYIGDMHLAPAAIAPGVTCVVNTYSITGGLGGEVTLIGDVQKLRVAGQEFMIDNICVKEAVLLECDLLSDNESLAPFTAWGDAWGQLPGDLVSNDGGIEAGVDWFDYGGGTLFNELLVGAPWGPIGSGNVLHVNNIGVFYNLAPLGGVASVSFDYCTGGGTENLGVDGMLYVGDFETIPAGFFPGYTVNVAYINGPGYTFGTVTVEGPVGRLLVGGQELYIDNVCVHLDWASGVPTTEEAMALGPNYPNPFNPTTTLQFNLAQSGQTRLTIVDLAGRVVATLVDEVLSAGAQQAVWNGRDDLGRQAASGLYFARLENGGKIAVRKIAMLK